MFFLALSCLQGRPMATAARDLLSLGPVGLQLTPGCVPTRDFNDQLVAGGVATRTHHGFSFEARRSQVWDGLELTHRSDSVHPPCNAVPPERFLDELAAGAFDGVVLETMYPGHCLGAGDELEQAMDFDVPLAVDVSHVHIQLESGVMRAATWDRLQAYDRVAEVHVSSNDGRSDQHRSIGDNTFGFNWATMKAASGTPLILENYMHRQSTEERHQVVALTLAAVDRWSA